MGLYVETDPALTRAGATDNFPPWSPTFARPCICRAHADGSCKPSVVFKNAKEPKPAR